MVRVQGSYTVEAALVVPIVLGCMLLIINQSIELYTEVTQDTVYGKWWQEYEPSESFRRMEWLKDVAGKEGDE